MTNARQGETEAANSAKSNTTALSICLTPVTNLVVRNGTLPGKYVTFQQKYASCHPMLILNKFCVYICSCYKGLSFDSDRFGQIVKKEETADLLTVRICAV